MFLFSMNYERLEIMSSDIAADKSNCLMNIICAMITITLEEQTYFLSLLLL